MDDQGCNALPLPPCALDECRDAVICVTSQSVIKFWNEAAARMIGIGRSEALGSNINLILPDFEHQIFEHNHNGKRKIQTAALTGHGLQIEVELTVEHAPSPSPWLWITMKNVSRQKRLERTRSQLVECARLVGQQFIDRTVEVLGESIGVRWVLLCEVDRDDKSIAQTVAFWADGERQPDFSYGLAGTPCGNVAQDKVCFYPEGVQQLFPDDHILVQWGVESYVGAPLHSSDGSLLGLLAIMHDAPIDPTLDPATTLELFAGRAGAEIERLHSVSNAERLGRIVEDAASEAYVFDAETLNFILVNKGARDNLGHTMAELRHMTPLDIKPELTAADFDALIAPLRNGSSSVISFQTIHRRKDGSDYNVAVKLQLLRDSDRPVFYAAIEDTSEQDAMLRDLQDMSSRLDTILNNTTLAVFLMNDRQECVYMNDAAEQLTGYCFAETQGRPLHDVIHHTHPDGTPFPLEECPIDRALPERNKMRGEEIFVHKDGSFYPVSYSASPIHDADGRAIGTVIEVRDISEEIAARNARAHFQAELEEQVQRAIAQRDAAEAQLRHSQKMEAIGKLTGGVAHDFNNLLQIIGGNLELLARDLEHSHRGRERLGVALSGVERGARLAQQLLAFGRKQPLNPRPCNLNRLFAGLEDLLIRLLGEQIETVFAISPDLWDCHVDEAQLENAILNLAINARDAMPAGGRLLFEATQLTIEENLPLADGDLETGDYLLLSVSDTGCGMSREIQERIFEPFFTTKDQGKGTGLGLSMVYGLMKQSGGHVSVYSEEGEGTTFRLYIPRSNQAALPEPASDNEEVPTGTETVLVVEDDDDVRITVSALLRELGYHVFVARDADAGMAVLESGVAIDLLFTDVVMPGRMTSRELAKRAATLLPGIAILFTSGYTENGIIHDGRLDEGIDLLSKPYSRGVLARRIRHMLDARKSRRDQSGRTATLQLLLVEDDPLIALAAIDMVSELGHEVVHASSARGALEQLEARPFDCVLLDLGLPDSSGEEVLAQIRSGWPTVHVIIASGQGSGALGSKGEAVSNISYMPKPYDLSDMDLVLSALS